MERLARAARPEHPGLLRLRAERERRDHRAAARRPRTTRRRCSAISPSAPSARAARGDRPLFLYLGFNAPHSPSTPATRDAGLARGRAGAALAGLRRGATSPTSRASFAAGRRSDRGEARIDARNQRRARVAGRGRPPGRPVGRGAARRRASSGGRTSVFTSDNGYIGGEHRIEFGKLLAYEPGSQVPLLMRGPGVPRGGDLRRARRQHRPGADDRRDRRRRADGRGRRPLAACRWPRNPEAPSGRALLIESLVRDELDLLRLPLRRDPRRALQVHRLRERRGGALQPRPRPVRARVARRRSRVRGAQAMRSRPRSSSFATAAAGRRALLSAAPASGRARKRRAPRSPPLESRPRAAIV